MATYGRLVVDDMHARVVHIVVAAEDGKYAKALCGYLPWPAKWINYTPQEKETPACLGCTDRLRKVRR